MDPAEVLAVEVRQFVGQGQRAMVPRVLGQTATAQQKKVASPTRTERQWDETTFFVAIAERQPPAVVDVVRRIVHWAKEQNLRLWWGKGRDHGSCFPMIDVGGISHWSISVWTYGRIQVEFGAMKRHISPFNDPKLRETLAERLSEIDGVEIPTDAIERYPTLQLAVLTSPEATDRFLGVLDWYVSTVRGVG